ncbi:MAG: DsbA family oxidoreductase [Ignavibacteriaceae bacterium]|nr:DsbA family oxidoreductase [Ignavibacteriaceae bacterium]
MAQVEIDIISDVVCPFCYIGKTHLERAIKKTGLDPVIRWHPFQLNPDLDEAGVDRALHMTAKFGSPEKVQKAEKVVVDMAEKAGIHFHLTLQKVQPNTFRLHKLLALAQMENLGTELQVKFFDAFFVNGVDLSKEENILDVAETAGLDRSEAKACLDDETFSEELRYAESAAKGTGVRAVPFFIFNNKFAVSGAQPVETFIEALTKAEEEAAAQPAKKKPVKSEEEDFDIDMEEELPSDDFDEEDFDDDEFDEDDRRK